MIQAINKEYNLDEMKEESVNKTNFTWFYSEDGELRPRVLAVDVCPPIRNMHMCDMERQHILVDAMTFDLSRVVYQLQCMLSKTSPKFLQTSTSSAPVTTSGSPTPSCRVMADT